MNKFEGIKLVHLESSDYVGGALSPTVEREIDTADIVIDGGTVVKNRVSQAEHPGAEETEKAPANLRIHKGKELTDNQKMDYKVLATNLRQAAEHLDACAGWAEMSVGRFTQSDPAVQK
ncbi:hypothetical protein Q2589_003278 [Salmonella enterica]|nr:hypothetical protein [Salmonella enterica]ELM5565002.1 hypothetical protein [Salmonella enterica]